MIPLLGLLPFAEKILDKVFPDPTQAAEAKVKLLEMQQNGELARLANEAELFKAEVADRDSARKRESDIAVAEKAPLLTKIINPLLAIIIVGGWIAVQYYLLTHVVPQDMREIIMRMLGMLDAAMTAVLYYHFGSSASSQQKNSVIASLSK